MRGVGSDPERRSGVRGGRTSLGATGRQGRDIQDPPRRGFGRRVAYHDFTTQAVLIAKQMPGTPVKLLWSREEDMAQGRYHPVMQCKLVGGFDANNNLTALHMRLSGQSILADVAPERL